MVCGTLIVGASLIGASCQQPSPETTGQAGTFRIEEATIADVHRAIQQGLVTCRGVVEAYVDRARAYNGVSDRLVTADGAAVAAAPGTVRAGTSLQFPTETVAVSTLLPDYDRYIGPPIELGRMEATASDPDVQQQYGMTVGTPDTNQINALGTLNLRGERSVTCKGDRDRHPSAGPLPAGSPAVCEEFRKQPDALERADELDKQYGTTPDLAAMPMYCVPFSFKDPFDTMDMRSTSAADAPTTSISRPATTRSSPSFDRRAPSSTPRPSTRSTTAFRATLAAATSPQRCSHPTWGISGAAGRAIRTAPTTRHAPPRSGRARVPARRSAPTS